MNQKTFEVNTQGRDFVCGDLHGCHSFLLSFIQKIGFDINKDRMFCVGDLIDRGPNSYLCLSMLKKTWFYSTMGNHEQLMLDFLDGNWLGKYWMPNGGDWWFKLSDGEREIVKEFYVPLVRNLPLIITVNMNNGKKFHIVHAEFMSEVSDEIIANKADELCEEEVAEGKSVIWGRYLFGDLFSQNNTDKIRRGIDLKKLDKHFNPTMSNIYSGHTIVRRPTTISKQTNIDTGAFAVRSGKHGWAGLTVCEPLTDKFWKVTDTIFEEVEPLII
jgi:serine/threonine protein phosphatase 1